MKVDVSINNNIEKVKEDMTFAMKLALTKVGLQAEGDAKIQLEADPRRVDTGRLRNSITHTITDDDGHPVAVIGTNVEYGKWVHEGTGIHAVDGGGRKTPWAYKDEDGNTHFTHGMKPNRFLANAIEQNYETYKEIMDSTLKNG